MELKRKRATGLAAAVSLFAAAAANADARANPGEAKVMQSPKPQVVFRVPFSDAHLKYVVSDMGVEASGWPEPLLIGGAEAVWVLDRGPEGRELRVVVLGGRGQVLAESDLLAASGAAGAILLPIAISPDPHGGAMVAAARVGDDAVGAVLVAMDAGAKVTSAKPFPRLKYDGKAVLTPAGELYDLEKTPAGAAWSSYGGGQSHEAIAASDANNEVAAVGDAAIEWVGHSRFRRLTPAAAVPLRSSFAGPTEGELVGGDGATFGIVTTKAEEAPSGAKVLTYRRTLTALLLNQDGAVERLGSIDLPAMQFSTENPREFTYYRAHQSRFAKDGTYFEIAWTASSLALERAALPAKMAR